MISPCVTKVTKSHGEGPRPPRTGARLPVSRLTCELHGLAGGALTSSPSHTAARARVSTR